MSVKLQPIEKCSGVIILNDEYQNLLEFPHSETVKLFKQHGFLLFKGFQADRKHLEEFAKRFSARFVIDPDRALDPEGRFVQQVGDGQDEIILHSENAASPFRPDIIWFCCLVPAAQNGETTFCDAVKLWEALDPSTQQFFLQHKIKYVRNYSAGSWKRFMGPGATLDDLRERLGNMQGISYRINSDESIYTEYCCEAMLKPRWGNVAYAFSNSIIYNSISTNRIYQLSLEDDSPIPAHMLDEIITKAQDLCGLISWEKGDLAMLDNLRFLHGRKAFTDAQRNILILQGMIR